MTTPTLKSILHAFIIALLTPILTGLAQSLSQGALPNVHQLEMLGLVGLGAGVSYLLKNLFMGSSVSATPIIILFLALCSFNADAQYNGPLAMTGKRGALGDTIVNTGTAYDSIVLPITVTSGTITTTITKISGTVSPTLLLQGSGDGVNWFTFGQDTDKITNSTGTVAYLWQLPGLPTKSKAAGSTQVILNPNKLPFWCYRIFATGTGTMSAIIKSSITPR